jgi:hypothetical protein
MVLLYRLSFLERRELFVGSYSFNGVKYYYKMVDRDKGTITYSTDSAIIAYEFLGIKFAQ